MLSQNVRATLAILAVGVVAASCESSKEVTGVPEAQPGFDLVAQQVPLECSTIDFDDQIPALTHGNLVGNAPANGLDFEFPSTFGFTIAVTTNGYNPRSLDQAAVYDTDNVGGPDFDLEWNGASATCNDVVPNDLIPGTCQGLGNVLIVVDRRETAAPGSPFINEGDSPSGGLVTFSGFPAGEAYSVTQYVAVDQEATDINLFVDGGGTAVASSTGPGGTDNIEICREVPVPPDGCTPGYWKQPHHFGNWMAPYDPTDLFSDHFDDAFPGFTLLEVLNKAGCTKKKSSRRDTSAGTKCNGLWILGFHTVAALLNAASPDVDFALTTQEVIDMFNAVYPGKNPDYRDLKDVFATFNEAGCPLGRAELP
jgi:hypothetical protein